jgi:hypothetical protein
MTPEQQKFWDILRIDPERLCHRFGRELQNIQNKKQFIKRADECFYFIMSTFDRESVLRTVKTWLCVYNLPLLDLTKMESFQKFHDEYNEIIVQKHKNNHDIFAF